LLLFEIPIFYLLHFEGSRFCTKSNNLLFIKPNPPKKRLFWAGLATACWPKRGQKRPNVGWFGLLFLFASRGRSPPKKPFFGRLSATALPGPPPPPRPSLGRRPAALVFFALFCNKKRKLGRIRAGNPKKNSIYFPLGTKKARRVSRAVSQSPKRVSILGMAGKAGPGPRGLRTKSGPPPS
jgi:hypothetical protein